MPDPQAHLIIDDVDNGVFRVHRSTMTSPEIYAAEQDLIFNRCWLYLGHESELRQPGDFVRRNVGGRPLIFVRSATSGEIHAFHNTCTHRGAVVCRLDSGNSKVFQCFYHAWSFDTNGRLVGLPDRKAYGPGFKMEEMGLRPVARVDSYRGFFFVCFDPNVEPLVDYLAGAVHYLDLIVDGAGDDWEVLRGSNQYSIKANWKLLAENSMDGYHALPTHDTYIKYLSSMGVDVSGGLSGTGRALGNGHAIIEYRGPWGRPIAKWKNHFGSDTRAEIDEKREWLRKNYGDERSEIMADYNRNLVIFPNLVINDIQSVTVRTFFPTSPDYMEISAWHLAPASESPRARALRLESFLSFLGPGGLATPDDVEALESCQSGFRSGGVEWNDISRGMLRDPQSVDEEQMRAFWRRWRDAVSLPDGVLA
ncbi:MULTISPECIES: aromatic ring-hydroxylating oxygenase subunit alpha [Mycobacteriaceae]|uniref:p-cumate dioxygenase large subunit (CmtAb) n=1 Tax=Mycolicibacterium neoaurum VKM Ac-1815D TaxID=700508 RepID=V5XDQ9_MYCNE|nr:MULTISPECIES: aromatic ring-hydroxylating dioxygenase subunit alpha [Mycobacteriaceae]AHC26142.1 p-cumate dioxygenase [Mycolicibacterium neoaurum VKM Ac-1815D]AMO06529.1 p-cumate dioxygenase [Mycolicibacterium neoaurum]AXK75118.1 aromatic ring-hydroxylating dioxygenase subunit alpha [Mycolicibacterium neoaurum]KJQ51185.1 p-cumate dioxygenase [Mycolicibacterium neoaurum]